MKRLAIVLTVFAAALGPSVPTTLAAAAVAEPGATTYVAPDTIDHSGATDATDALNAWIATGTDDGVPGRPNRIVLNGTYRIEYGLSLGSSGRDTAHPGLPSYTRDHVIVDLTNATLLQTDSTPYSVVNGTVIEPRKRWGIPILSVYRSEGVTVLGGRLFGANRFGRYSAQREPWHGIDITGAASLRLDGQRIEGVWGDFVYINHWEKTPSHNIVLANGRYERNGRQGVTVNAVDGLEIAAVEFRDVERVLFDHEPGRNGAMTNVDIHDSWGTSGKLGFMSIHPTPLSPLHDITVRNHRLEQHHFRIDVATSGTQRERLTLTNNTSLAAGPYDRRAPLIQIGDKNAGFHGVTIQHNRDMVAESTPPIAISPRSTDVVTEPNDFTPPPTP